MAMANLYFKMGPNMKGSFIMMHLMAEEYFKMG
jgi:hypothetical protein